MQLHSDYAKKGLRVVGITPAADSAAEEFVAAHEVSYPVAAQTRRFPFGVTEVLEGSRRAIEPAQSSFISAHPKRSGRILEQCPHPVVAEAVGDLRIVEKVRKPDPRSVETTQPAAIRCRPQNPIARLQD